MALLQYDYIIPEMEPGDIPPHPPRGGGQVEIQGEDGGEIVRGVILVAHEMVTGRRYALDIQISELERGWPELRTWIETGGDIGVRILKPKSETRGDLSGADRELSR